MAGLGGNSSRHCLEMPPCYLWRGVLQQGIAKVSDQGTSAFTRCVVHALAGEDGIDLIRVEALHLILVIVEEAHQVTPSRSILFASLSNARR